MQFVFVLTASKKSKLDAKSPRGSCYTACCYTDLWDFFVLILMQDGPFLALHLFIMADRGAFSYTILFVALKNAMVVVLYLYRVTCSILEVNKIETTVVSQLHDSTTAKLSRYIPGQKYKHNVTF